MSGDNKAPKKAKPAPPASREDRLAAQLRANLGRRKAQARARTAKREGKSGPE